MLFIYAFFNNKLELNLFVIHRVKEEHTSNAWGTIRIFGGTIFDKYEWIELKNVFVFVGTQIISVSCYIIP